MRMETSTAPSGTNVVPFNTPLTNVVSTGGDLTHSKEHHVVPPLERLTAQLDPVGVPANPLRTFSLLGELASLKERAVKAVPFMGKVALMGQSTVLYAAPNTGKTLVSIRLLVDAIVDGRVDPQQVYYINMDDTSDGLYEKGAIAEEYGFHMIAAGEHDFQASNLVDSFLKMAKDDTAKGCVVVIDTLKKFVDIMDKSKSTEFGKVMRTFTQAGGTLVALAHTNKNAAANGKMVPAGTADIQQDVDCGYLMTAVKAPSGDDVMVTFENIKRRGDNESEVVYRYTDRKGVTYRERFDSVSLVGEAEQAQALTAAMMLKDDVIIGCIVEILRKESLNKTELVSAVRKKLGTSAKNAGEVIVRYCGNTAEHHLWSFDTAYRGAQMFKLNLEIIAHFHPELSDF